LRRRSQVNAVFDGQKGSGVTEVLLDRHARTAGWFQVAGIGVVSAFFASIPVLMIRHRPAAAAEWLVAAILGAASLVAAAVAVRQCLGHERVLVEDGRLRVIRKIGPLQSDVSVLLQDIRSVDVPHASQAFVTTRWGLRPAVVVTTAAGSVLCGDSVSPVEAERMAERIRSHAHKEGGAAVEQMDAAGGRGASD
jgi:hypothetical protein